MSRPPTRRINLALQGGGAHGAYTWGVLDRLLEDEDLEIAAISGTSAGALNGAALKAGLVTGGPAGARANLDWLWGQVGPLPDLKLNTWMSAFTPTLLARALELSPAWSVVDMASRVFSPYDYGPAYENPLARLVTDLRFEAVCSDEGPPLHVCATNVRTGKIRLFTGAEITPEAILASACLPTLFRAVEIEDPATGTVEAYWDGGYTGNPALFPLYAPELPADIVVVNINPLHREELPTTVQQIQNRINEIGFNTSLLRELRAIDFVQRLIETGAVREGAMKKVLVHMIADDALMNRLSVATKTIPLPTILDELKRAGRAAADTFLDDHRADLGVRSTVDLRAMFD